jgi:membrane fusion protein, multidrug efflux system
VLPPTQHLDYVLIMLIPKQPAASICTVLLLALSACTEPPEPDTAPPPVRPALIVTVGEQDRRDAVRLPGRIRAAKRAELSFDVPGFVDRFSLDEGRHVKAGEIVAHLDDGVYKARLASARAEFERARNDLARYQRLWDTEMAVARAEVDDRSARLELARTNLAAAEQDLANTVIKAPFAGVITRRRIEPFTNVQAKQPIAELQDLSALEVVINVPERLVRRLQPHQEAVAFLDGEPGQPLALALRSFAAEADPQTQTYVVVLALQTMPAGLNLLPGMAVNVEPLAASASGHAASPAADAALTIPLAAVAADAQGQPGVWVVDEDGRVARAPIRTGAVLGAEIVVDSGLVPGQRIVGAGVGAVREGMLVRPLESR